MRSRMKTLWQRWARVGLVILTLAAVAFSAGQLTLAEPSVPLSALKPFSLAGTKRLLIFAPHCDDETLGTAGLILAAQRQGIQVRVVIATNGDGYLFATIRDFKKIYPLPADYIKLGELRQQESLAALAVLGVAPSQVTFLSYPDRGTPAMWNDYWSAQKPYRSPYSEDSKSPYALTYNPKSVFAGEDYLGDITSILKSFRPDMVVYPNPDDVHPDHWGLNAFVRLAIDLQDHSDPSFHPNQYTYLVHRPDYPDIKGLRPQASLTPPIALYNISPDWYRLDMPAADTALKGEAVQKYRSQLTLLRTLMDSFIRSNELFAPVQDGSLATLSSGKPFRPSTWLDANGQAIPPVQKDPIGDFITRTAIPASDLTGEDIVKDANNDLLFCVDARDNTAPEFVYTLRLKALTTTGIISYLARTGPVGSGHHTAVRSGPYACAAVSLASLGNPWAVFVGSNVVGGGRIIDEVAWQMVEIKEP